VKQLKADDRARLLIFPPDALMSIDMTLPAVFSMHPTEEGRWFITSPSRHCCGGTFERTEWRMIDHAESSSGIAAELPISRGDPRGPIPPDVRGLGSRAFLRRAR
jgi:hypothetical protein